MDMGGGRLIRIMIMVLVMVLVWKIWDYSALPAPELPSFSANSGKEGILVPNLQNEQEQNSVLQAPVDEHLEMRIQGEMEKKSKGEENKQKKINTKDHEPIEIKLETENNHKKENMKIRTKYKETEMKDKNEVKEIGKEEKGAQKNVKENNREVAVTPTMRIEVYYEVLCPDSRHFIMKQLTPAYEKLKDILQVGLVPYGKAVTRENSGKVSFECQHGPKECEGNIVHACVTNIVKDEAKQIGIVHCMIDRNEQPMVVGKKCVEKYGEDWGSVSKCVGSEKGSGILKHMGEMTQRLKPGVTFIPTITIDGSQEDQKHILQDFHKVLCKRYKGPKQPSC